jgi:VWFA-related protein
MRTFPVRAALLALAAALALADGSSAQEPVAPEPPPFQEEIAVTEVLLDALVTDREGNVVIGLGKDDFAVEVAGTEVPVESVTFYSNRRFLGDRTSERAQELGLASVAEDRYFIFFLHDQGRDNSEIPGIVARQIDAVRQAKQWLREERLAGDWVAVASYDTKLKIHQDFTRGHDALSSALDDAAAGRDPGGNWPSRLPAEEAGPSLRGGLPRGNELRDATRSIYDGLSILARAAGNIRGRKNLVLLTTGFGRVNDFGLYMPDPRYYPPMSQALNANNVAVYGIDLMPLGTEHTMSSAMNQLANDTGGRYYFNFTTFATPLRQISTDNNGYYLLSFQATRAGKSGYREVQVKTRNPDFAVRTREGFQLPN